MLQNIMVLLTYHTQSEAAALSEESVHPRREGDTSRGATISWDTSRGATISWDTPWGRIWKCKKYSKLDLNIIERNATQRKKKKKNCDI